eukprot:Ihof_evm7s76 gene=Ihof_evmTU7s76
MATELGDTMAQNTPQEAVPQETGPQVSKDVELKFKQICNAVENLFSKKESASVSNKEKLYLYSRYKQATIGDVPPTKAKVSSIKDNAMWEAWNEVKGSHPEEMMKEYITMAEGIMKKVQTRNAQESLADRLMAMMSWGEKKHVPPQVDLRDRTINEGLSTVGIDFDPNEDIVIRHDKIRTYLEENKLMAFYNAFDQVDKNTCRLEGKDLVQLSSYSYLNLMTDSRLLEVGLTAVESYGLSSHGTRSLAGTTALHVKLEETIANFVGKESALSFSTAYLANIGVIPALCRQQDFILLDHKAHRSLVDGCTLSRATIFKFKHSNLAHCTEQLAGVRKAIAQQAKTGAPQGKIYLVSDTVFSMDGDIFPLPSFHKFCKTNNITLILDEAHGLGVIGKTGRGIEEHFDMPGAVDVLTGTLGKSIPAIGGFCAGSKKMMRYIQMYGNPCVFSSPLPPFYCAVAQKTFEILMEETQHVERLHRNAKYFIEKLKAEGYNVGTTETAVVPLILCDMEKVVTLYRELLKRGYWVACVIPPA